MIMIVDWLMTLVSICFAYSLVPQLVQSTKAREVSFNWQTLWINSLGLCVMSGCFIMKQMPMTSLTTGLTAVCWSYLLVAKIKFRKV